MCFHNCWIIMDLTLLFNKGQLFSIIIIDSVKSRHFTLGENLHFYINFVYECKIMISRYFILRAEHHC